MFLPRDFGTIRDFVCWNRHRRSISLLCTIQQLTHRRQGDGATPAKTACAGSTCRMAAAVQGVGPQRRPSHRSLAGDGGVRWGGARCARSDDGATNSTAMIERERLGQERLAAEQEQQRTCQERMETERLAELDRRVERECVEAETVELERQKVLERLDAAMARGQEAEHERQEGEKAIRDEAVRVEAESRGYGVRLAEEDGTLAAKAGRLFWTRPRTARSFPASFARRTRRSKKSPP